MKKIKYLIPLTFLIIIELLSTTTYAINIKTVEYSDEYKEYINLNESEKNLATEPAMYDIPYTEKKENVDRISQIPSYFNLKDKFDKIPIRNQQKASICWAFATLSSLETNLAILNNNKYIYDFSEMHMDYYTTNSMDRFNKYAFNRPPDEGGNWNRGLCYLTNGIGAINESDMPFNEQKLLNKERIPYFEISRDIKTEVYDTNDFVNYNKNPENKEELMNKIKLHIMNSGSIYASLKIDLSIFDFYDVNYYLPSYKGKLPGHAVSIIGWDDNYSKENFKHEKPQNDGAWIARNSWGEERGEQGYLYISYEDVNVGRNLHGIEKAKDKYENNNIYQYNIFGESAQLEYQGSNCVLLNEFDKQKGKEEYMTKISLYVPETYTCKVLVNANNNSKEISNFEQVKIKGKKDEIVLEPGYHTIEFENPIKLNKDSNKFLVAIEIEGTRPNIRISTETILDGKNGKAKYDLFDNVIVEKQKCYLADADIFQNESKTWHDLGNLSSENPNIFDSDSTIKAFTLPYNPNECQKIKDLKIKKYPNKRNYYAGENFLIDGLELVECVETNDGRYNRKKS